MKARIPKGASGASNLQQLAKQAQQMQQEMDKASENLSQKEYTKTSGGGAVSVTVMGSMEVKSINIAPEVIDPDDIEMLSDLIIAATNEALRAAENEKSEVMEKLSGSLNMPGMPGLF